LTAKHRKIPDQKEESMTTTTTQTTAECQAGAVAAWFRSAGWTVDLHRLVTEPKSCPDSGEQYTNGRRYTWVSATRDTPWTREAVRHIHAGWVTITEPIPGRSRSTRFIHLSVNRVMAGDQKITSRKAAYALFRELTGQGVDRG
jgi:hypothetical protein